MMNYKGLGKTKYFVEGVTTIGGQAADPSPPDWPRVHALEPGLRPLDENDGIDLSALSGGSPLARFRGSLWERVYLELCAMAAVRWLPCQPMPYDPSRGLVRVRIVAGSAGTWFLELDMGCAPDMDTGVVDWETFGPCESLSHALFAAVEAVLKARKP